MIGLTLVALAQSAVAILGLCIGDPKRRRAAGRRSDAATSVRPILVGVACLPGVACVLLGETAAFMLWLAGSALIGWFVATCFVERGPGRAG